MKEKLVIRIAETTADLFYMKGDEMVETVVLSPESGIPPLLEKCNSIPLHIMWDMNEVSFRAEDLPPLNLWDLWRLAQPKGQDFMLSKLFWGQRIMREEGQWHLMQVGVGEEGRAWIHWMQGLENPIGRVSCYPYEDLAILKKVCNRPRWQMLVTLHQKGTLRVNLFHYQQLMLTRKLPLVGEGAPELLATQIASAIDESVQYMRRQHDDILDHLNLFVVVDQETRRHLDPGVLAAHQFQVITPHQLALRLGEEGKAPFRFSDDIILKFSAKRWRPLLSLSSASERAQKSALLSSRGVGLMGVILCSLLYPLYSLVMGKGEQMEGRSLASEVMPLPFSLSLSSLVYSSPDHWTLWLNDKSIQDRDSRQFGPYYIEAVKEDHVGFSWKPAGAVQPIHFRLQVKETYVPERNAVVNEGAKEP